MEIIEDLLGKGKDLSALQMSCRALIIFMIAYMLIRLSGRRSFGLKTPLDNIIVILLGAILSRAIVGASPFLPVIAASITVVILHRIFAWLLSKSNHLSNWFEGKKTLLYQDGHFLHQNMRKCLISKEEVMHALRKNLQTNNLSGVHRIYMERNGEITVIKDQELKNPST